MTENGRTANTLSASTSVLPQSGTLRGRPILSASVKPDQTRSNHTTIHGMQAAMDAGAGNARTKAEHQKQTTHDRTGERVARGGCHENTVTQWLFKTFRIIRITGGTQPLLIDTLVLIIGGGGHGGREQLGAFRIKGQGRNSSISSSSK